LESLDQIDNALSKRFVIYTAIFGLYDELIEPNFTDEIFDFVCFTDRDDLHSDCWKVIKVSQKIKAATLANRMYKMLPHKFLSKYEASIYIDANIEILKNPIDIFLSSLSESAFAFPSHFLRSCIYDEANTLLRSGRLKYFEALKQMICYRRSGFISQVKMGEHNILFRDHSKTAVIMESWWREYLKYPSRDQLSLAFVLWRDGFTDFVHINQSARKGGIFLLRPHSYKFNDSYLLKFLRIIGYQFTFFILKEIYLKNNIIKKLISNKKIF